MEFRLGEGKLHGVIGLYNEKDFALQSLHLRIFRYITEINNQSQTKIKTNVLWTEY